MPNITTNHAITYTNCDNRNFTKQQVHLIDQVKCLIEYNAWKNVKRKGIKTILLHVGAH